MAATQEEKRMMSEAAEYLERPLQIERQIREVIERRQEVEQAGLHGIDYSRSGGSRSADQTSRTERLALKAAELQEEHEQLYAAWCSAQLDSLDIILKVQQLDARAALVLTYTCVSGLSAAATAERMEMSERQIFRLRKDALLIACKVMNDPEPEAMSGPTSKEDVP